LESVAVSAAVTVAEAHFNRDAKKLKLDGCTDYEVVDTGTISDTDNDDLIDYKIPSSTHIDAKPERPESPDDPDEQLEIDLTTIEQLVKQENLTDVCDGLNLIHLNS